MLLFLLLNSFFKRKISNYIHYLIGDFSKDLVPDILNYLKENDKYDCYVSVVDLCRLFDASTLCWEIYEYIVSKISLDDKLINEIECLLFNTGVVSGEDGIVNSFKNKYDFFKCLKSKNEKVMNFVNKQKIRFKNLYQEEKNKVDKELIQRKVNYELEHKDIEKVEN